jgi:F-type H+-transporting ATPase subunit delta
MQDESVARRYAAALFAGTIRNNSLEVVQQDLGGVVNAVNTVGSLKAILAEPTITEARKAELLEKAFGGSINDQTLAFLKLLTAKRRIELLGAVNQEFVRLSREHQNVASAIATTAVPLTPDEETALIGKLAAMTGKRIELTTAIDSSVLGGVFIRIGDTVYDGTVRGNLERLREQLLAKN